MTSMGNVPSNGTLANLGFQALELFDKIKALKDKIGDEWQVNLYTNEAERFKLWSANLGLFARGHGSLDYRVREAETLLPTLKRFLQELITSLRDVISTHRDTFQQDTSQDQQDKASKLGESDDEDEDSASDFDLLVDGIRDPINRLFKMATKIRSPSARFGSLRAANYQQIDKDSGVDFLHAITRYDRDYVRSVILQHEKSRACQASEPIPPEKPYLDNVDEVWEPIRTVLYHHGSTAESFLVNRIAQANVRRRQQFAYWARHREKLAGYMHESLVEKSPETEVHPKSSQLLQVLDFTGHSPLNRAPTVTTATTFNVARFEVLNNRSTWTVSEYAPSTWQSANSAGEKVDFPPPPKLDTGAGFECPYCFTLCSRETLAEKAWKAHLIHDLRPYICTYEDCLNPTQLYDTRRDWSQHENSVHRRVWRCLEHSDRAYFDLEEYKYHLKSEHADSNADESSLARLIQASESVQEVADRACPICRRKFDTARQLEGHIALHLERLAIFSLPRFATDDNESKSNAASDKVHGVVDEESYYGFDDHSDLDHADQSKADQPNLENEAGLPANTMVLTESAIESLQKSSRPFDSMDRLSKALDIRRKYDEAEHIDNEASGHEGDSKSNERGHKEANPWIDCMENFSTFLRNITTKVESGPIKIAIIDDGIDVTHPDLHPRIAAGMSFFSYRTSSNFVNTSYHAPSGRHGTLMSTLIRKICPDPALYVARLEPEEHQAQVEGGGRYFIAKSATQAVEWATACNVDIISIGWTIKSQVPIAQDIAELKSAFDRANEKGILTFCPADDKDESTSPHEITLPGGFGSCFRIGAANSEGDVLASVNNYDVDYLLPGIHIPFEDPKDKSCYYQTGSFLATACAAGLAGDLLYSGRALNHFTKLSHRDIENAFNRLQQGTKFINVQSCLELPLKKALSRAGWGKLRGEEKTSQIRIESLDWEDSSVHFGFSSFLQYLFSGTD